MADLFTQLQKIASVKSRVVALENFTPNGSGGARNDFLNGGGLPLTEVVQNQSSWNVESHQAKDGISASTSTEKKLILKHHKKVDSSAFVEQTYLKSSTSDDLSQDAYEILKSQPDHQDLLAVLHYLQFGIEKRHDFNVRAPSAKASQIIKALVNVIVVDHWHRLGQKGLSKEDRQLKSCLVSCLSSVTGIGALLAQVKKLSTAATQAGAKHPLTDDLISALQEILSPTSSIYNFIRNTLSITDKPTQRHVIWQELISLLAGSKVLTVVAQISGARKIEDNEGEPVTWLGDGPNYCKWLANNIAYAAIALFPKETEAWSMLAQMMKRGWSLGNRDRFVAEIYTSLLLGHKSSWTAMHELLRALPHWEQRTFFDRMMNDVARKHMNNGTTSINLSTMQNRSVEAAAALVAGITSNNKFLQDYMVEWLVDDTGANASIGIHTRRAVMATLANHEDKLQRIIDRCMERLCDKVQIQHASLLQQEATVQTMLLAITYLDRSNHDLVKETARSSPYIHAVSNRLGSSIPRARWLGMVVGVAISRLVDDPGQIMDFGAEEMDHEEAKAWLGLVHINDHVGHIEDLKNTDVGDAQTVAETRLVSKPNMKKPPTKQLNTSKIISVEELEDDEIDGDDLVPYRKPDDDPSDSEEDPTLIDRSKPVAPVYILDLIRGLNVDDKPEVVQLALTTAPSLIRRKAAFGTELSENIDRVASSLLNLSEGMSKPKQQKSRLKALIACVVAQPDRMGPWLASMYFEGDFSLVQRATLLTTIGLGCREVAAYTDDQALETPMVSFPSKRLPNKLSAIYMPINAITNSLSRTTLRPIALAAADTVAGPNILKVRTFSSRLEAEKRASTRSKERSTRIPKNLHSLLTSSFYLPLCSRMSLVLSSRPQTSRSSIFEPHIFRLFLQTLTILINTLGPHAIQLNIVTRETLLLLTHLHNISQLSLDPAILPPTLQLLLSIVDLNMEAGTVAEERLVTDFGPSIAELMAWIGNLHNMNIPTLEQEGEGMPWTVVAAGCQVKWQEIGRKFQGRMVGLTSSEIDDL